MTSFHYGNFCHAADMQSEAGGNMDLWNVGSYHNTTGCHKL